MTARFSRLIIIVQNLQRHVWNVFQIFKYLFFWQIEQLVNRAVPDPSNLKTDFLSYIRFYVTRPVFPRPPWFHPHPYLLLMKIVFYNSFIVIPQIRRDPRFANFRFVANCITKTQNVISDHRRSKKQLRGMLFSSPFFSIIQKRSICL